ncbi:MAG TPA: S8 family serine peptidase [Pyrinomonadaceae bacterium]|nr:S8 family serine peptidase [Pyrinomonadaceae bacterium]
MRQQIFSKRLFVLTVLLALVLIGSITGQRSEKGAPVENKLSYVPGELLVKFKDGAESNFARSVNSIMGTTAVETLGDNNWQRVKLPDGMSVEGAISSYSLLSGVDYAQPNYYYHILATPNDAQFTSTGMYGLTKIGAYSATPGMGAWDLSTGSSSIVVADIDTGLGYTHQDIAANAWSNPGELANGVDDDGNGFVDDIRGIDVFNNDTNPIDDNASTSWHGTHTAGTIGAVGNNALGVVGVNWNVKLMSIKLYASTGGGTNSTSAMLVNAYAYITMMKLRGVNIRATNNSYGNCGEACGYDQATKDGIDAMGEAGIVNVYAAGNDNNNNDTNPGISYPSVYNSPSIISVASSTSSDSKSSFSSYGLTSVDLAAPGSQILSTVFSSTTSYGSLSGTSMATPHVTGAVALLASYRPDLSVASLKASLLNNVDVLPAWSTLVKTGGRLNVFKAMQNPTVCNFNNGATQIRSRAAGGTFSINIPAATNCDYFVKSNNAWVTRNTAEVMSGTNTVSITVGNNTGMPRTGSVTIGGQIYTIVQGGSGRKGI